MMSRENEPSPARTKQGLVVVCGIGSHAINLAFIP